MYRILEGDVMTQLKTLPGESVQCVVTPPRRLNGTFMPGTHWRTRQPFYEREWLEREYIALKRSTAEIAAQFGLGDSAIQFWLKKHGIPTRTTREVRKMKAWGVSGIQNPMFGRTGSKNPNWCGGTTPLRQQMYASLEWKHVKAEVRKRDHCCLLCGSTERFHYHHIVPFCRAPLLGLWVVNVCRLCLVCHRRIRGKEMRYAKRLQRLVAGKGEPVR